MKRLAQTTHITAATPEVIFKLWEDIDNWADYDHGIEWAKLTDGFTVGGQYILKPKGGPKVKATILVVEPASRFVDVSHLVGANLKFDHRLANRNGTTATSITITISGPMSWLWARILDKNQQADLDRSTANLIAKAEKRA
jgi:hypothetical protein